MRSGWISGDPGEDLEGWNEVEGGGLSRLLSRRISAVDGTGTAVPARALLLSLLCLAVPVVGSALVPDWLSSERGLLIWVLALVPPFLLSFYREWKGAAAALAGGMAAFSIGNAAVVLLGSPAPSFTVIVAAVSVLVVVALGTGVLSSLFENALRRAREQALIDPLTHLPNRRHAMLHLHRMFAAAQRGRLMSAVVLELDQLERIRKQHGRGAGEQYLLAVARVLRESTRTMNLSARVGDAQFLAILDGVTAQGAVEFAERVQQQLEELALPWQGATISAGISQYEEGMASPDVLIAAADQGLYRATKAGGDRVVLLARAGRVPGRAVASHGESATPPEDFRAEGQTILVVDDEPAVLQLLTKILMRAGYQVLEAHGPGEALTYGDPARHIDLIVSDIVMPEMSGFRLVEVLSEHWPDLKALYISGYAEDEIEWAGVPGKAKRFLSKPLQPRDFLAAVERVLAQDEEWSGPEAEPASSPIDRLRMRGDPDLVEHLQNRLGGVAISAANGLPLLEGSPDLPGPDILVLEDLDGAIVRKWEEGLEPLPDLVIALNMSWSARIQALQAGVIDVLPHDMLAGELEARVAGVLRRQSQLGSDSSGSRSTLLA